MLVLRVFIKLPMGYAVIGHIVMRYVRGLGIWWWFIVSTSYTSRDRIGVLVLFHLDLFLLEVRYRTFDLLYCFFHTLNTSA